MGNNSSLLNAIIGAVATSVLGGFVPFAPALGGAIAGYLEGGRTADGLRVGAISGIIGFIVGAVFLVFAFLIVVPFLFDAPNVLGAGLLFVLLGLAFSAVYTIGLILVAVPN